MRKGHDASQAEAKKKIELGEGVVRVNIAFEDKKVDDFAIPATSTFSALSSMVTEITGADAAYRELHFIICIRP